MDPDMVDVTELFGRAGESLYGCIVEAFNKMYRDHQLSLRGRARGISCQRKSLAAVRAAAACSETYSSPLLACVNEKARHHLCGEAKEVVVATLGQTAVFFAKSMSSLAEAVPRFSDGLSDRANRIQVREVLSAILKPNPVPLCLTYATADLLLHTHAHNGVFRSAAPGILYLPHHMEPSSLAACIKAIVHANVPGQAILSLGARLQAIKSQCAIALDVKEFRASNVLYVVGPSPDAVNALMDKLLPVVAGAVPAIEAMTADLHTAITATNGRSSSRAPSTLCRPSETFVERSASEPVTSSGREKVRASSEAVRVSTDDCSVRGVVEKVKRVSLSEGASPEKGRGVCHWVWEGNVFRGTMTPYDPPTSAQIERAFVDGKKGVWLTEGEYFGLRENKQKWYVDFEKLQQVSHDREKVRRVSWREGPPVDTFARENLQWLIETHSQGTPHMENNRYHFCAFLNNDYDELLGPEAASAVREAIRMRATCTVTVGQKQVTVDGAKREMTADRCRHPLHAYSLDWRDDKSLLPALLAQVLEALKLECGDEFCFELRGVKYDVSLARGVLYENGAPRKIRRGEAVPEPSGVPPRR